MILDHQYAHPNILHHERSQRHHTARDRVLHSCDPLADITSGMFRSTSSLPVAALAIAAATMIAGCGSSSSSSGSQPAQAQVQQEEQDAVRFADCMRSSGVSNFPDPESSPREFKFALALTPPTPRPRHSSVRTRPAITCCRAPADRARARHRAGAQIAADLAFARCLRSHGFPSFPDPSSTGQLTHEMVASAGINLHQPAAVRAADTCVSVTHGFLTRADVARFVAGQ